MTDFHTATKTPLEVPPSWDVRQKVWAEALAVMETYPRARAPHRSDLAKMGRRILSAMGLEQRYLGYAMVQAHNAFWLDQFLAVPLSQRFLMLPRCLGNLDEVRAFAERLKYRMCIAEGSPEVVRYLAHEDVNAVIGIGCLDSLERIFSRVSALGVPSIAVPLNEAGCKATSADTQLITWFLESHGREAAERTHTYLPFLRMAHDLFDTSECDALLEGIVPDPPDETVRVSLDWLRRPGKRLRPFCVLAAYHTFQPDGDIPTGARHLAMAVETFHKASLIHDDIEDDEDRRYGGPPLHVEHGIPIAINIGDYLIGLGYRLAARAGDAFGPGAAGDLLGIFSATQGKLTQGQGMELFWRRNNTAPLTLDHALRCSMLKTSAAFEAALASAMTLAGCYAPHADTVKEFSRYLGAAFQLKNDMHGVEADAARVHPTALLALAFERATEDEKVALLRPGQLDAAMEIYARRQVMERGEQLAARLKAHAVQVAQANPGPLGNLFHFLVDIVLG
jgi:geranylgeranyl diphosphate synthase, type II